jgi:hypothetical protein
MIASSPTCHENIINFLSRRRERVGVRPKVALWPVDIISVVFPLTLILSPRGERII